jgi:hypothetical protein
VFRSLYDHAPLDLVVPGSGCAAPEAVDFGDEEYGENDVSDTEFTPGPWIANGRYIGVLGHKSFIGECKDVNGNWSDTKTTVANANLIAAAPELYEALDQMVAFMTEFGCYSESRPVVRVGMQALAKARGEKS